MEAFTFRNIDDVRAIEAVPIEERVTTNSTYELLTKGAAIDPDAVALYFLLSGEIWESPIEVTYKQFHRADYPVSQPVQRPRRGSARMWSHTSSQTCLKPLLLWGAEAAGIANPINPMLEPAQIRDIMNAAKTKVLVALGEYPGSEIWTKVDSIRKEIPTLEAVVQVMGASNEAEGIYGYDEVIEKYGADNLDSLRSIEPDEVCSMYHTGGTTGTPKLAMRTHMNEMFSAFGAPSGLPCTPARQ